jgi:hypothetical protein
MEFFQFKPSSTVTIGPPGGTGKPHHGHHGHHGGPEHHLPFPHGPWVSLISLIGDARSGNSQLTISPNPRLDSSTLPTPDTLPFGSSSPSSPSVSSVSLFSLLGSRGRLGSSTGTYSRSHAGCMDTSINANSQAFRHGPHLCHGLLLCHGHWTRYHLYPYQGRRCQPREPPPLPTGLLCTYVPNLVLSFCLDN